MPTSATGRSSSGRFLFRVGGRGRGDAGFTLIELLVALVIAALLVSLVAMSGTPSPERAFRQEGDRIAQLLMLASEEAQIRSAPIRFQFDERGYQFVYFRDSTWRVLESDPYLRPRAWEEPTRVVVERPDGDQLIEFGRDVIEPPFSIQLRRERYDLRIIGNGLGTFEVVQPR